MADHTIQLPFVSLHDLKMEIIRNPNLWGKRALSQDIERLTRQNTPWSTEALSRLLQAGFIEASLTGPIYAPFDNAAISEKRTVLLTLETVAALRAAHLIDRLPALRDEYAPILSDLTETLKIHVTQINTLPTIQTISTIMQWLFRIAQLNEMATIHDLKHNEATSYALASKLNPDCICDLPMHVENLITAIFENSPTVASHIIQIRETGCHKAALSELSRHVA